MNLRAASVAVVLLAGACGDLPAGDGTTRPGSEEVYDRIEGMTDCGELQNEFDTAMTNAEARPPGDAQRDASMGYAEAAESRMRELSC